MKCICIGPNCWGRGETKETAMENCANAGPGMRTLKKHYLLYEVHDDASVEECFGDIVSPAGYPPKLLEKVEPKAK